MLLKPQESACTVSPKNQLVLYPQRISMDSITNDLTSFGNLWETSKHAQYFTLKASSSTNSSFDLAFVFCFFSAGGESSDLFLFFFLQKQNISHPCRNVYLETEKGQSLQRRKRGHLTFQMRFVCHKVIKLTAITGSVSWALMQITQSLS